MTRGIQLKQLSASNLDYLGLPAHLLSAPPAGDPSGAEHGCADEAEPLELAALDAALAEVARQARQGEGADAGLRALTREVRHCLEAVLTLLTEALPASPQPAARRLQAPDGAVHHVASHCSASHRHHAAGRQLHAHCAARVARDLASVAERQVPNAIRVR